LAVMFVGETRHQSSSHTTLPILIIAAPLHTISVCITFSWTRWINTNYYYLSVSKEHFNYYSNDKRLGPLVMSIRYELLCGEEHVRTILRFVTSCFAFFVCVISVSEQNVQKGLNQCEQPTNCKQTIIIFVSNSILFFLFFWFAIGSYCFIL